MSETKLPHGWSWATIGELVKVATGATPKRSEQQFWSNGSIPWVTSSVVNQPFVNQPTELITQEAINRSNAKVFPVGTLLVAMYGEGKTRGKVTELNIDAATNQALAALVFEEHNHELKPYIKAYFEKNYQDIRRLSSGGVQPNLNLSIIKQTKIPLAPLNEQKRIVEEIETQFVRLDQAVAGLKRVQVLCKQYRASLLKAACEGRLVPQNGDDEPADILLQRILAERRTQWEAQAWQKEIAKAQQKAAKAIHKKKKLSRDEWEHLPETVYAPYLPKNEKWKEKYKEPVGVDSAGLPPLPDGWQYTTFHEISPRVTVGHVGSMKNEYVEKGISFLRSQNVRENRFDPNGLKYVSQDFHTKLSKSTLHPGDLVVVRSGSVGVTCVIPESMTEANCSDLVIVKKSDALVSEFGAYFMNSLAKKSVRSGQVGVALIHFNTKSVAELTIGLPPLPEQERIVAEVAKQLSRLQSVQNAITTNLQRAKHLRQSILNKAFRGALVPQHPADEPASTLLANIRANRAP